MHSPRTRGLNDRRNAGGEGVGFFEAVKTTSQSALKSNDCDAIRAAGICCLGSGNRAECGASGVKLTRDPLQVFEN